MGEEARVEKKIKEKHGYWLDNCLAISNDLCLKPSGWDLREESSCGSERRLKLPVASFYLHRPISAEKNKNGSFHTSKDVDGSLARCAAPAGAWGPVRVLPLAIFFQETDEALKKKKKIPEMMARSAYCSALQMWSASIN